MAASALKVKCGLIWLRKAFIWKADKDIPISKLDTHHS
jgi:hypothetical protein